MPCTRICPHTHELVVGLPWPNPDCPVIMVECEDGQEEKAQSGNVGLAGSSFFNRAEALLTLRHDPASIPACAVPLIQQGTSASQPACVADCVRSKKHA